MTPGTWFPDPTRRHELRYWDGAHWTEHVSDRGTASRDPLPAPADQVATGPVPADQVATGQVVAPPARHVYVDAQLQIGFKHKRFFVDDQAIWWDGASTPFAAVTGYSHWVTHMTAGPAHNYDYRIRLWQGGKNSTITFTGRGEQPRNAFDAAAQALYEHSGRRRLEELLRRVDAGEEVPLANWTLSRTGAVRGRKTLAWSEPIELRATQAFAGQWVYVTRDGKQRQVGDISSEFQDGPLLRRAFGLMQQRYGTAAAS